MSATSAPSVFFLTSLLPYLWLAAAILCVICESAWHNRVSLCPLAGCVCALGAALFGVPASRQTALFVAVSAVALLLRFAVLRPRKSVFPPPGSRVLTVYTVSVYGMGKVRWNGTVFDAVLAEGTAIQPGDTARVVSVMGDTVQIRPDLP